MQAPPDITGRTIIVTGAGQGIGRTYAEAFAAVGGNVVVADVNHDNAAAVAESILGTGGKAVATHTDVTDEASTLDMARRAGEAFGRIDVLVNNAALYSDISRGPFESLPVDNWRRVLDVNVTGGFLCARAVLPAMRDRRWGRIVNISSTTVQMGRVNFLHYVTSKAAVVGMTRSMARELGADGITVNAVMPGLTDTGIETAGLTEEIWELIVARQSIPRRQVPDDLIGMLMYLASDASAFVTGQTLAVDGGNIHL